MPPSDPASSETAANFNVPPSDPLSFDADTEWTSIRSMSLKAMTPVSLKVGFVTSSLISPIELVRPALITGPSFAPVTVTVTNWSTVAPWPSSMVTVNVSTAVCPSARYWADAFGTL